MVSRKEFKYMEFFENEAKEYLEKYGTQDELDSTKIFFSRGNPFYIEQSNEIYQLINGKKGNKIEGNSLCDSNKPCVKCGLLPDKNGHDPCLKNLPNVKSACCGHGVHNGYITFENGIVIIGKFEVKDIKEFQL